MRLNDKIALITGAASGIGRETALLFAKEGAKVACSDIDEQGLSETVKMVEEAGGNAIAVRCNVADHADCQSAVAATVAAFGGVDVLGNIAGMGGMKHTAEVTEAEWSRVLGVNLNGTFFMSQAAIPHLTAQRKSAIVHVASVAGLIGQAYCAAYCASKAAVNNLTITLARVFGPTVRVNGVAPGFIAGDWLEQGLGAAYQPLKQAMESRAPLGKVCVAEDVAAAILGLICGSDLVTGNVLPVEGGMLIGV